MSFSEVLNGLYFGHFLLILTIKWWDNFGIKLCVNKIAHCDNKVSKLLFTIWTCHNYLPQKDKNLTISYLVRIKDLKCHSNWNLFLRAKYLLHPKKIKGWDAQITTQTKTITNRKFKDDECWHRWKTSRAQTVTQLIKSKTCYFSLVMYAVSNQFLSC